MPCRSAKCESLDARVLVLLGGLLLTWKTPGRAWRVGAAHAPLITASGCKRPNAWVALWHREGEVKLQTGSLLECLR
ncbi:hypothetical protein BCR34DRAFT_576787 [Clohesyomyces aquaticus]|uniref:Uncharacterized protein n=1 Tax=Clohesyomyces aquaticus TaxID=1231657 RepID=A0A1Y1YLX3_9PLEO|nr:hypothetical protein BCR34DRAFT_576787 [Clohesyomyces aquaticus]